MVLWNILSLFLITEQGTLRTVVPLGQVCLYPNVFLLSLETWVRPP